MPHTNTDINRSRERRGHGRFPIVIRAPTLNGIGGIDGTRRLVLPRHGDDFLRRPWKGGLDHGVRRPLHKKETRSVGKRVRRRGGREGRDGEGQIAENAEGKK